MQFVYRIFYYDALPFDGKAHHPLKNINIDYGKSDLAGQRRALFALLRKERKIALRLGKVKRDQDWTFAAEFTKPMLRLLKPRLESGSLDASLSEDELSALAALIQRWQNFEHAHVNLSLRQKGVDMRIGIDIASLALKKQVTTIVLVAGDSDFVPAAKLARREGIDFILDPLWQQIESDLHEHIDGLQSGLPKPNSKSGELP